MTLGYWEHPEATSELLEAIRYYHRKRAGLGDDFAARARAALRDVVDSPDTWPRVLDWNEPPVLRGRKFRAYPYRVVYYIRADEIVVIAYAHEKRRPGYWQGRMTD